MPSKQTQTLAGMPNEVLHAICQCLYPEDIKILRLVDKRMCDLSSEYLMKKAYYALRPKAHAVFQEICDHPVFSRSVVELVYDASMFTKKHAHDPRPESDEKHRGCLRLTEASREIAAMEYAKLLESQDYLISSGHSEQALLRGFRKLKNLKSIFYTDWQNIMLQSWHLKEPTLTVGHTFQRQSQARLIMDRIGIPGMDLYAGMLPLHVSQRASATLLVQDPMTYLAGQPIPCTAHS